MVLVGDVKEVGRSGTLGAEDTGVEVDESGY
jgi:hypothetical protein